MHIIKNMFSIYMNKSEILQASFLAFSISRQDQNNHSAKYSFAGRDARLRGSLIFIRATCVCVHGFWLQ